MRTVLVALAPALVSMPADAQMTQTTARSEEQKRADRDADRAYRAMMKQVSDKPRSTDPWAGVRNRDAAVAASTRQQATVKRQAHLISRVFAPLKW